MDALSILNVHTPTTSFSVLHSLRDDAVETLFERLSRKMNAISGSSPDTQARIGPGWLKYELNGSIWTLDDDSDYRIFAWRMGPTPGAASSSADTSPTLFAANPRMPLPSPMEYRNSSFYAFRPAPVQPSNLSDDGRGNKPSSLRSAKSRKSTRGEIDAATVVEDYKADYTTKFNKFHGENGVRTVTGQIGPVENVRMLLRKGHRHVYVSRSFALENGFIPRDTAPGHYGYTGLVQIGKWPIKLGRTTTVHDVYLSEEAHFDVILGRSFMERRGIKLDALDPTSVVCTDTGETVDCDLVVIKDYRGEVVTIT